MRADELRQAVGRITDILVRADLRGAVDRFRVARGDDRTAAAATLRHAGALVAERFESLSPTEGLVVRSMHLLDLSRPAYWETLTGGTADPRAAAGELVRLASRVVFATGQLPGLTSLLDAVDDAPRQRHPAGPAEARLVVRLADAGERACDPDRIARSIDGIDMLYSACASIARKPAMDLRLEAVDGEATRDIHLTGERDAVAAVVAVLDSIPEAVAGIDEDADMDLDELVRTLPVFRDLATLGRLGSFSEVDLRDIAETMHQGALLTLESGVVLVPAAVRLPGPTHAAPGSGAGPVPHDPAAPGVGGRGPRAIVTMPVRTEASPVPDDSTARAASAGDDSPPALARRPAETRSANGRPDVRSTNGSGGDRHYDEYLREREAMRRAADADASEPFPASHRGDGERQDQTRKDAVEALLKSLGKARGGD